jgi:5-bromo-4-chloroindolyl phosphate hydrolysis protein
MALDTQRDRELRAARNQALFRAVNEKLRELNEAFSDVSTTYAIACECADVSCVETVHILMDEYVEVREHPNRFAVLADHVYPEVERVVAQTDGYVIVEKNADVSHITEATHRPEGE